MSFTFQGFQLAPGMHDERSTDEAQFLWGRWDQAEYVQAILDKDTVDSGNSPTTQLRTGLALGVITATGQFTHWNPYATDGSNYLVGFLLDAIDLSYVGGTTKERLHAVVVKGNIKADWVVIPGQSTRGISGKSYEFLLREQCQGRFVFNDDLGKFNAIKHYELSGNLTATTAMHNTLFILPDAVAGATLTLPAPVPGLVFGALNLSTTAGNALVLEGPATGEYYVAGAAANSVSIAGDTSVPRWVRAVRTATTPTYQYVVEA